MLCKVADFYDDEVDAMVKALTSLIEPLLIVSMGVLVGFMAISFMSLILMRVSSIQLLAPRCGVRGSREWLR